MGSFCGVHCNTAADCPAGFDCGGVIFSCNASFNTCPGLPNGTATCLGYTVENEPDEQFFCSDSSGPHEYFKACAPSSGFCPASAAP